MRPLNPRQYFATVELAYKLRFNALMATAKTYLYNHDYAVDAVQDSYAKAVEHFNKHPDHKVRESILHFQVIKACKRYNRKSKEIPFGLFREELNEDDAW